MADKTWKKDERKIARFFGVMRNPLSGSNSRHSESDSLHPKLFIEQKRRKRHAVIRLWDAVKAKARKEKKIPVITLTEPSRSGFWIVLHCADLEAVARFVKETETV